MGSEFNALKALRKLAQGCSQNLSRRNRMKADAKSYPGYVNALPKAIGLAKFAEEHGEEFGRLIFARKKGEKWEFADMCDKSTRAKTLKMQPGSDIGGLFA